MNDDRLIIGIDPSISCTGISDGDRHEVIKTFPGMDLDERIDEILTAIDRFIFAHRPVVPARMMWVVEAPMLAPGNDGGGHLYEIGNLMRGLRSELAGEIREQGVELIYLEVQIGTLRRFTIGAGNAPKVFLPYAVEAIHGKVFENDRGCDKLVAWSAHMYGRAVLAGDVQHAFAAPRGQGHDERKHQRKAERTRKASVA